MKKPLFTACTLLASAFVLAFFCASPQNPFTDPKSAVIVADSSLSSLKDSVKAFTTIPCSVSLYLPDLIDSIRVFLVKSGYDSVIAGSAVASNEYIFDFVTPSPGVYQLKIIIVRSDNSLDSLVKQVTVYLLQPVVSADSSAYHIVLPADSFIVSFSATDPDSNLRFGYTWIDTALGETQTTPFVALKPFHGSISRTVKGDMLHEGLFGPIICHAYAIDADSLISAVASCTLFVADTTKPAIRLLTPDTAGTISTLPVPVKAIVTDLSGIEAVTFNGASMVMSHDTASYEASSIDSGKSLDSIIALDRLGNRAVHVFHLNYSGKKLYPPKIIDLSRATTEGHPFALISLDASVTLTDTSITNPVTYKRDSLTWVITDSLGNQIAVPVSHIITIPFPSDTEWTGTIKLTFRVTVKNNPSLYDTKQPAFFVAEVYDPPVITFPQSLCSTTPTSGDFFLDTITTVRALDNKLSTLNWTFKKGKHFQVDSVYSLKALPKTAADQADPIDGKGITPIFGFFNRHIRISNIATADTGYYGTDTLQFTVTSPQGPPVSKPVYFTHAKICLIRPFP